MVFAEYRDTIDMLIPEINTIEWAKAVRFIGQTKTSKEKGMSQVEQKQTLDDFRSGIYNVLVSTSIGEEGIDIPTTSLVLFYEPVPSAIRYIQRKGRTARDGLPGEVWILIMKNSRDEGYYWNSVRKEKKMYSYVYKLKDRLEGKKVRKRKIERQSKIGEFFNFS
jgi:Fanconi anemia group M protein